MKRSGRGVFQGEEILCKGRDAGGLGLICWRHRKPGWLEQRQVVGDAVRGRPGPGV